MLNTSPQGKARAFRALPCVATGAATMDKRETKATGGADWRTVAGVERLRLLCEILTCDFMVAFEACDNDILARADVAEKLGAILTCNAAFDDCGMDRELRRIAPLAIAERREKLNAAFGLHNDAPVISDSEIDDFILDFRLEESSRVARLFGEDITGVRIKYTNDPLEIRARKKAYIVEWDTRELRREIGRWLYYSRAESIAELSVELRNECFSKGSQTARQEVIDGFITVAHLRELAFIANAESRRVRSARRHERDAGADACESESRLNAHAQTLISEYRPRKSFILRTETGTRLINDLSPKQWDAAIMILEGNADGAGWVKMPDGWKKPKLYTGTQEAFWLRVHSRVQDGTGDGAGYFRIEKTPVKSKRGGKRANAGRKAQTVATGTRSNGQADRSARTACRSIHRRTGDGANGGDGRTVATVEPADRRTGRER